MYNASADILQYINNNSWHSLITPKQSKYVVDVYLNSEDDFKNIFNQSYVIKLDNKIRKENNLILLFPQHPDEHKRVLRTNEYKTYPSLGHEINTRLRASRGIDINSTVVLAIVSRGKVFRFRSLHGTAYIVWAERVNLESINDQENIIASNIPIFYELDGEWNIRNIVIFPIIDDFVEEHHGHYRMYPINLKHITNLIPTDVVLFSYESDNRNTSQKTIKTVSADRAEQMTRDLVARRFIDEDIDTADLPFSELDDSDDSVIIGDEDSTSRSYLMELVQETPRVNL